MTKLGCCCEGTQGSYQGIAFDPWISVRVMGLRDTFWAPLQVYFPITKRAQNQTGKQVSVEKHAVAVPDLALTPCFPR